MSQFVDMVTNIMPGLGVCDIGKKSTIFVKSTDDTLTDETAKDSNEQIYARCYIAIKTIYD